MIIFVYSFYKVLMQIVDELSIDINVLKIISKVLLIY